MIKNWKRACLSALICSVAVLATAAPSIAEKLVLKLGHPSSLTYPSHIGALKLAEEVARRSNGEIEIQVFPLSQLGGERDLIEGLQLGTVDMAIFSNMSITNFVPAAPILELPFFYKDGDHILRAIESPAGQRLMGMYEDAIGKLLGFYKTSSPSFYNSVRPIHTMDDLKGLKLRAIQSNIRIEFFTALGALPIPLPFSEVYGALQQGIVDGADNDPASLLGMKHYEYSKYYSLTKHVNFLNYVFISRNVWASLTPEQQQIIEEATAVSEATEAAYLTESVEKDMAELKGLGVEINDVDTAPMIAKVAPLWDSWVPAEYHDLLNEIRAVE
ncbi:TRAP transporter substrate-binding protein [Devosia sp.]|uniref:TRAP transporter substrate-binding protein n=1 Tax=Devosia sp. TaxID=1871048 RepID=UPI002EE22152